MDSGCDHCAVVNLITMGGWIAASAPNPVMSCMRMDHQERTTEKCALFNYVLFDAWKTCLKWHQTGSGVYVPTNPNLADI